MYWEWVDVRPLIRPLQETDPTIDRTQGSNPVAHPIARTPTDQATCLLGVFMCPTGDVPQHLIVRKSKADAFASRLPSPELTVNDFRVFHRSVYTPAMKYTLPAVAVDKECFAPVQSKILAAILNGIGVARTIPTAIRHGPISMEGLDLLDLRTEAGISAIQLFRESIFSMSETGKMILVNLYHSQLEPGLGTHLLERPDIAVSYLTPTWLASICQFLFQHNLRITLTDATIPALQTNGDQFIMSTTHLSRFTDSQCYAINLVRLYLQVFTLCDVSANQYGKTICPEKYCGR